MFSCFSENSILDPCSSEEIHETDRHVGLLGGRPREFAQMLKCVQKAHWKKFIAAKLKI